MRTAVAPPAAWPTRTLPPSATARSAMEAGMNSG